MKNVVYDRNEPSVALLVGFSFSQQAGAIFRILQEIEQLGLGRNE